MDDLMKLPLLGFQNQGKYLRVKFGSAYAVEDSSFGAEADLAEGREVMVVGGGDAAAARVEHVGAFRSADVVLQSECADGFF